MGALFGAQSFHVTAVFSRVHLSCLLSLLLETELDLGLLGSPSACHFQTDALLLHKLCFKRVEGQLWGLLFKVQNGRYWLIKD